MSDCPIVLANILGPSYSGSTWLSLMLGAHTEAFSAGEMGHVMSSEGAVCQIHGPECPLWSRFRYVEDENLFVKVARFVDRRVIVVNRWWDMLYLYDKGLLDVRLIHLVRDGRAVVASILRKFPQRNTLQAIRQWKRAMSESQSTVAAHGGPSLCVWYENLVKDTAGEIERICAFLGLKAQPEMLEYWKQECHFLGGNRGTLHHLARTHNEELPGDPRLSRENYEPPEWGLSFYEGKPEEPLQDERWRSELSLPQRLLFAGRAGHLNRRYGYPAFTLT